MTHQKQLKITDLTFRDGHQSLFATRLKTEDMLPVAEQMDAVGFYAVEVWGGATFDVMIRFLNENPWDRVRLLRERMPNTRLQMLLRGQNLVGYRNYPDDVVDAFVEKASEVGIDIFRIFDALNDERNLAAPFAAVRKRGKHVQGAICYSLTLSEKKLGGPIYNLDYFVSKAKVMEDMGASSLCIKDMAGILSPYDAFTLVSALKETVRLPLHLHTHHTSGMASMACLKAIEAGVDGIDTCLAPFALRSSHPAIEPFIATLRGTPLQLDLNLEVIAAIDDYLESIVPKYVSFADGTRFSVIDIDVLLHQIPGGMISNLVTQLKQGGALNRLKEVFEEIPRTRKDLGYPPLVTPTSQIVGVQAVLNVLAGRYKIISKEVRDYCYGLYGRPPASINPELQSKALKGYDLGEIPIQVRPADILEPELPKARQALEGITDDLGDILIYALFGSTGMEFLRKKYGIGSQG